MSEKPRRIKVVVGEGRANTHVIDADTGQELSNRIASLHIYIDKSTDFRAVARVEFMDVEVDLQANVEVETTKSYRRIEGL